MLLWISERNDDRLGRRTCEISPAEMAGIRIRHRGYVSATSGIRRGRWPVLRQIGHARRTPQFLVLPFFGECEAARTRRAARPSTRPERRTRSIPPALWM